VVDYFHGDFASKARRSGSGAFHETETPMRIKPESWLDRSFNWQTEAEPVEETRDAEPPEEKPATLRTKTRVGNPKGFDPDKFHALLLED
jgi:hypothetical protein